MRGLVGLLFFTHGMHALGACQQTVGKAQPSSGPNALVCFFFHRDFGEIRRLPQKPFQNIEMPLLRYLKSNLKFSLGPTTKPRGGGVPTGPKLEKKTSG